MKKYTVSWALALSAVSAACERGGEAEAPLTPAAETSPAYPQTGAEQQPAASGAPGSVSAVVERIAQARCSLAQRCNQIGPQANYSSHENCMNAARAEARTELNDLDGCPRGVDQEEVQECLDEINDTQCGNPVDRLASLTECKVDDLCID